MSVLGNHKNVPLQLLRGDVLASDLSVDYLVSVFANQINFSSQLNITSA
jgi:hypothetical protein